MILLPAIDILGGKAVRLAQGSYDAVTVYNEDPAAQALEFKKQGATWVHIVDLDGARTGVPANIETIERIIRTTGLRVEVGGGVRSLETIERLAQAGAARIVLGTKLVTDPDLVREACRRFGGLIVAGVDARDGEVAIEGWREGAGVPAAELVKELKSLGVFHLVYTDIARDGMQTGIDAAAYAAISKSAGFPVTASGGISSLEDLCALARLGTRTVDGAIAGRAIYEGSFTVAEAVALLKKAEATTSGHSGCSCHNGESGK